MVVNFGYGALFISFLVSLYGIGAAFFGYRKNSWAWVESARSAMLITFPLITLSAFSLVLLLITDRYEVEFVYTVTSMAMPGIRPTRVRMPKRALPGCSR